MPILNYEQVQVLLQKALKSGLSYVPDDAIIITGVNEMDTLPTFKTYLIRIAPPDSDFIIKLPKIGQYFRYTYVVAIELWLKSGSRITDRLLKGHPSVNKGLYEFFHDVTSILEHNTLDGQLDPYPGSNITVPVQLASADKIATGMGFLWYGNRDSST